MNKPQLSYFTEHDVLHLSFSNEAEAGSVEISPNVTAELNASGELIGVEIIAASLYLRDFILESTQAKLLELSKKGNCLGSGTINQAFPPPGGGGNA